jgi:hypothetical protein
MRFGAMAAILFAAGVAGCGSTTFSNQDLRVHTTGDTLYLVARSDGVSRSLCGSLGGDVARAEARWAANEGRTMQLGRVSGCHTVRHVIVCPDDDAACVTHEEQHRSEGAFHP